MTSRTASAAEYLACPANSFWQWREQGNVISWPDGTTIAFRPQLRQVLEQRLVPQGLPPFGSVVLLLAACRESWPTASTQFKALCTSLARGEFDGLPPWLVELPSRLDEIHRLPREYRESLNAQLQLVAAIFEGIRQPLSPSEAAELLGNIDRHEGELYDPGYIGSTETPLLNLLRELNPLAQGLARFDPQSLELRRRTGLDQLVEPAPIELTPAELARGLITNLVDDAELGGVARVARRLLAVATLPRPLDQHEELPLGGVSDITNRGPLDRLLLSELAYDDTTLAVRVAVNEALYLRRETPPRNPPRRRAVLIDVGLRLWGVPRVFAAAVALAFTASSEPRAQIVAYSAGQSQREPQPHAANAHIQAVELSTREGLIEHLAALCIHVEPSASVEAFFVELAAADGPTDAVLITSDDVLTDEEFQRKLTALALPPFYIAAVNRGGGFRLLQKTLRGCKLLREVELDLDTLLAPRTRPALPLVNPEIDPLWPAIFSTAPFPLLLPTALDPGKAWPVSGGGVLSISNDHRLHHWTAAGLGARQLSDQMPRGDVHWFSPPALGTISRSVVGPKNSPNLHLVTAELSSGQCQVTRLELAAEPAPQGVFAHGGAIFVVQRKQVAIFSEEGRRLTKYTLPDRFWWSRGRFFRGPENWQAMAFDGISARLEPVLNSTRDRGPWFISMFERFGQDSVFGITPDGSLFLVSENRLRRYSLDMRLPLSVRAISSSGDKVALASVRPGDANKTALIDVDTGAAMQVVGDPRLAIEPLLQKVPRPISLRHKFETLHLGSQGELVLTSSKGRQLRVMLDLKQDAVYLRPVEVRPDEDTVRLFPFEPHAAPEGVGYTLRQARWNSGRAILDSRGMLHLQSTDPRLPELTLVLWDGALALWSSDGRTAGPKYFTAPARETVPASVLYREVLQPIVAAIG